MSEAAFSPETEEELRAAIQQYSDMDDEDEKPEYWLHWSYGRFSEWDVSRITNMSRLFSGISEFNEPLNSWNVSQVTNMEGMFDYCTSFNQPLSSWNVENVTNMKEMFAECQSFNQSINSWNVGKVENMDSMFANCILFNQSLESWQTENVSTMNYMFIDCRSFNQPLSSWNVEKVVGMKMMFAGCTTFNQPLNAWGIDGDVTNTEQMFDGCSSFNQPLNSWVYSTISSMNATTYNSAISEENRPTLRTNRQPLLMPLNVEGVDAVVRESAAAAEELLPPLPPLEARGQPVRLDVSSYNLSTKDIEGQDPIGFETKTVGEWVRESEEEEEGHFAILNPNGTGAVLLDRSYLTPEALLNYENIVYQCYQASGSVDEQNVNRATDFFKLRSIGLSGVVNVQDVFNMLYEVDSHKTRLFKVVSTGENLLSTVSYNIMHNRTRWMSAAHCQEGQEQTVFTIQRVAVDGSSSAIGGQRRSRRRHKSGTVHKQKKQHNPTHTKISTKRVLRKTRRRRSRVGVGKKEKKQ